MLRDEGQGFKTVCFSTLSVGNQITVSLGPVHCIGETRSQESEILLLTSMGYPDDIYNTLYNIYNTVHYVYFTTCH